MAKIRTIKPELFRHEELFEAAGFSRNTKLITQMAHFFAIE